MTLTFDLDLTLTLRLTFDLDDLRRLAECALLQGTFSTQLEVSTTSGSKVMAQRMISMVIDVFDLDLDI